jgi:DNA-directed RNA polymerase specialized sigma24 family protein
MRPFARTDKARTGVDARDTLVDALDAHAGLILRSAAQVLGSLDDAQDVAQDIAEKLLRAPPTAVRSWPAFLKTMSINAALDRLRRRKHRQDFEPPQSIDSPDQASIRRAAR